MFQGHRLVGSASIVGWDQRRFVAPAHQNFPTIPNGGPAFELSWSHPTMKKAMALDVFEWVFPPSVRRADDSLSLRVY